MKRVCHSIVAFVITAEAVVMTMIAADLYARPAQAQAEDWPTRPLTLVVPFSAGGSSDTIGRIIADGISSNIRQPVVVENVAGAGSMLAGRPHLTAINSLSATSAPSRGASGSTRRHLTKP
jgi:tripartite-type tricarboxylate transporter receptor subunit TctC